MSNMELLKSGFKSVLGAPQPGVQPTGAETVERLVDRVQSSTLLEDRRDAVRALKALSRKFRLEVGTQAMDPLISILEVDRNDSEIVSYALETLCNIMSQESLEHGDSMAPTDDTNELGKQFTEIFIKKSENVSLLLGLLEEYDSHVRWPAVQLLTCLLNNKLRDLQDIILVSPMGVSKLMDLLLDSREFIRNDTLLLLYHLTKNNANIQKIVAFENAFDRLLIIINEEGNSDGGIVVEDCLQLLLNLLKNNSSNQTFFKEGSFIQHLMPFFTSLNIGLDTEWSAQKISNINLMLQVVRTLVSPSNPLQVTSACQKVMNSCGLLEQLCNILMAAGVPADILTETLNTVSEVIRGNHNNQEYFASITAPCTPPRPAIVVLMMSMVNEKQPFILRCSVLYCFQSFLYKNELGQAQIVQTLLPTSADVSAYTAGQLLCGGLFSQDSLSTWCAAISLSHALIDNTPQKEQLLRVQLATNIGNPPVSLLQQCTTILQQGGKVQTRLGLLMLLSIWLSNCPLAVSHFVSIPTNIPYLTSQVALAEGDDLEFLVQGICAFLLGICVNFNDDSVASFSKESLCQLIAKRIGLETFLDKLGQISKHEMYSQALQKPQPKYKNPSEVFFDHEFCRLFKVLEGQIIKAVTPRPKESLLNGPEANLSEAEHSLLVQYKNLIREQDQQLNELRQQLEDLQVEQSKSSAQVEEMTSTIQQLKDQNALLKAHKGGLQTNTDVGNELLQLKQEFENLKKQLEEKNMEMQEQTKLVEELKSQLSNTEKKPVNKPSPEGNESSPEIETFKSQISELKMKIKELENENKAQLASVQLQASAETEKIALQSKIDQLVEELENVRKEQEDLLVLLTEQDTKITTYTSRLKELGEKIDDDDDIDCEDRDLEDEEKD